MTRARGGKTRWVWLIAGLWLGGCGGDGPPPLPAASHAARHALQARALDDDREAQYQLAFDLMVGRGGPADTAGALYWMATAAERGHPHAQYHLGSFYTLDGPGQDYTQALRWLRTAAESNHAPAQLSLGTLTALGLGTAPDLATGYAWVSLAADRGLPEARTRQAELAARMDLDTFAVAERAYHRLAQRQTAAGAP